MSYRNAIPDIARGSLWVDETETLVSVVVAAAGWVTIRTGDRTLVLRAADFRRRLVPRYDRERIRSQFSMSLANLGDFRVFWLDDPARIVCRSISCSRHFAIPAGAREVGIYSQAPGVVATFFEDLEELLRGLQTTAAAARATSGT